MSAEAFAQYKKNLDRIDQLMREDYEDVVGEERMSLYDDNDVLWFQMTIEEREAADKYQHDLLTAFTNRFGDQFRIHKK